MNETDLMEMVSILMEMPKEVYFKCKQDLLNDKLYEAHESMEWLKKLFAAVEKHRPELLEEKGGAV